MMQLQAQYGRGRRRRHTLHNALSKFKENTRIGGEQTLSRLVIVRGISIRRRHLASRRKRVHRRWRHERINERTGISIHSDERAKPPPPPPPSPTPASHSNRSMLHPTVPTLRPSAVDGLYVMQLHCHVHALTMQCSARTAVAEGREQEAGGKRNNMIIVSRLARGKAACQSAKPTFGQSLSVL